MGQEFSVNWAMVSTKFCQKFHICVHYGLSGLREILELFS